MILGRSFLFITGLFFLSCTESKPSSDERGGKISEEGRYQAVGPQYIYTFQNKSDKQVRWLYPGGKKEIIAPGGCLHYRGFSIPYGIYIYAGDKKVCGSNQGKKTCKLMNSSEDTSAEICGKGSGNYLCPAEGSFDITRDLILQENGKTVSTEDFASSCPMLEASEKSVTPIRQGS